MVESSLDTQGNLNATDNRGVTDAQAGVMAGVPRQGRARSKMHVFSLETLAFAIAVFSGIVIIWSLLVIPRNYPLMVIVGVLFLFALTVIIRVAVNPESIRAYQTDDMLRQATLTLNLMQDGLTPDAAQKICTSLLPSTAAIAVAITDKEDILGYVGFLESENPSGSPIRTQATHATIKDGKLRVINSRDEIGFPDSDTTIKAAIIVPLRVGDSIEGTLKFYYRRARQITKTQVSIAQGFGNLLSTQMSAIEMENQRKLATKMELAMLQSQINPHFLFNTINTIAALTRTDPMKARDLLREFAVFYRRTLEDSADQFLLSRELEQTERYFSFVVARFGEDRLGLDIHVDDQLWDVMVPPFIIQPIVENAVKHAMPTEGKLTVTIDARVETPDVVIEVKDDGKGMSDETRQNLMHPRSETGMGIALKNVHDRMKGYFGSAASLQVNSKLGEGTQVILRFPDYATSLDGLTDH